MAPAGAKQVFQIKVSLDHTSPPVWRRILVPEDITLARLHDVLQIVMGWEDYHLHEFTINDEHYGDPTMDEFGLADIKDESHFRLNQFVHKPGLRFKYEYDFGDSWRHTLLVEKILPMEKGRYYPVCLKGLRACPPEDVGGVWGYYNFLEAISNPAHPEHQDYLEWVGGKFDPQEFNLQKVNDRLKQLGKRRAKRQPTEPEWGEMPGDELFMDFFEKWIKQLDWEQIEAAENLSLLKDTRTLITYLRDNKVVGTRATGNLPLKAVAEIAANFVRPLKLELRIGDQLFRVRSEDDVWPLRFLHILAFASGLLEGGPSRRWRLTPLGYKFLDLPSPIQAMLLLWSWWGGVDWLGAFPFVGMGEELPLNFEKKVLSRLLAYQKGETISYNTFADEIIQAGPLTWHADVPIDTQSILRSAVERMIIGPLESFGVIDVEYRPNEKYGWKEAHSFRITPLGRGMLEMLSYVLYDSSEESP